jgi:hypothetical protein
LDAEKASSLDAEKASSLDAEKASSLDAEPSCSWGAEQQASSLDDAFSDLRTVPWSKKTSRAEAEKDRRRRRE